MTPVMMTFYYAGDRCAGGFWMSKSIFHSGTGPLLSIVLIKLALSPMHATLQGLLCHQMTMNQHGNVNMLHSSPLSSAYSPEWTPPLSIGLRHSFLTHSPISIISGNLSTDSSTVPSDNWLRKPLCRIMLMTAYLLRPLYVRPWPWHDPIIWLSHGPQMVLRARRESRSHTLWVPDMGGSRQRGLASKCHSLRISKQLSARMVKWPWHCL